MSKKNKKSNPMSASEVTVYLFRILVTTYVCVFFLAMPLFYHDKYYDIGDFKYSMFMYITVSFLSMAAIMLAVYIFTLFTEKKVNAASIKSLIRSLSVIDWFVIAFAVASILSYLFSPSRTNEFPVFYLFRGGVDSPVVNLPWEGYKGWNMGLRSQLVFCAVYFLVSRLFMRSWRKDFLFISLTTAFLVFLFGVLHRFHIDPLGLYDNLQEYHMLKFLSTLGQSSWYSSFMVVLLPIGMAFFEFRQRKLTVSNILLTAFVAMGGATFVTQNSDSAYLAFAAIVAVLFALAFTSNDHFLNFLEMMIIMLGSMKVIGILQILFPDKASQLDSLSFFVSKSFVTWMLLAALIAFYVFIKKVFAKGNYKINEHKTLRNVLVGLIIASLPLGIIIGYLNTKGMLPITALQSVEYLNFNDNWGNNRGYTWRNTIELMQEPLWRSMVLTGPGPDCYATVAYAVEPRASAMQQFWAGEIVVCCHNEWLNMLFNEGILGFVSYLGIFVSAAIVFMKKCNNPVAAAGVAAIFGYFFHNLFCYQQILCTPMIFCVIALCEWVRRTPDALEPDT